MAVGAALELDADALDVDRTLVPVPGDALDADLGDDAAETAEALDQGRVSAFARGADGGREAAGAAAHHKHLGLQQDRGRACCFVDLVHATSCDLDGDSTAASREHLDDRRLGGCHKMHSSITVSARRHLTKHSVKVMVHTNLHGTYQCSPTIGGSGK